MKKNELILTSYLSKKDILSISLVSVFFLFFFIRIIFFYLTQGHLPEDIFHNHINDMFMDFYNINYNAFSDDRYISFKSLYPPINFLIAQFFVSEECRYMINNYDYDSVDLRSCDIAQIFYFYILTIFISIFFTLKFIKEKFFTNTNNLVFIPIAIIFFFSFPMLYELERGNYIIFAYLLFVIYLNLQASNTPFALFLQGMLINLKPYFLIFLIMNFFKRSFLNLFLIILISVSIFVISSQILGDQNVLVLFNNILSFGTTDSLNLSALNFSASYLNLIRFIKVIFSIDLTFLFFIFFIILSLLMIYVFWSCSNINNCILISILYLLAIFDSVGPYFLIFLLPFFGFFYKSSKPIFFIFLLILLPFDIIIFNKYLFLDSFSFLSKANYTDQNIVLGLNGILRPLWVILLFIYVFIESINLGKIKK